MMCIKSSIQINTLLGVYKKYIMCIKKVNLYRVNRLFILYFFVKGIKFFLINKNI